MIESSSVSAPGVRTAVQRRGIERTQAILDSAETILAEQGYAAATLKAIGEHAGIPTASLYHYFADRGQVEAELVRRHIPAVDERFAASLYGNEIRTLRDGVDAMIDPLLAYFRDHPGFVQLWFAGRSATLSELGGLFDESWAEKLWHFLIEHKLIVATTPLFAVQLMFEVGDRLFDVAFQRSPKGDDATMDEGRRMLTAYLTTYAPSGTRSA
ncbi:TetR/AcrR family transcriptional regulator [Mycolicibacterium mucogenicum]|uniref:TetR/AcrR family transcriptional regulator n=1 Tax=Mycolicibacterium mucogenicum TaxID=56689 RepID=UPI0006B3606A|nr:TetR/AcrR family transcriptional regulator [Mycolicibacterium mucogenicum]KAB7752754.1 TetR family transcriptional regulator [Mycolicibacterium mucogenicum DSM 44124]